MKTRNNAPKILLFEKNVVNLRAFWGEIQNRKRNLLLTQQTEIWYISSTEGQRVSVSAYMTSMRNHIQRGALFLFVSVGFTRALFVTKEGILYAFCCKR